MSRKFQTFRTIFVGIILPILAPVVIILAVFYTFVLYKITHPNLRSSEVSPYYFGLPYSEVHWQSKSADSKPTGDRLTGWFIPGSRGAPVIILCHGYGSNRSETLDIAASLQRTGYYNVLLFNMRGHGQKQYSRTSLGLHEKEDVLGAIDFVLSRPEVDKKVGLWGASTGAYAALAAAAESDKVVAIAADSIYPTIESFIQIQAKEILGTSNALLVAPVKFFFALYFLVSPPRLSEPVPVGKLTKVNLLFITGSNSPALATFTRRIYVESRGNRDILSMEKVRDESLTGDERKLYDERILGFFRKAMPVAGFASEEKRRTLSSSLQTK